MRAILALLAAPLLLHAVPASADDDAGGSQAIFERHAGQVVQIRISEATSGAKSSIGSGFRVGDGSVIATNYHVVSEAVLEPERYRVETVTDAGLSPTAILAYDVVSDLALVAGDASAGPGLALHPGPVDQGDRLWSLGNPLDLGLSIVEGIYNGPQAYARQESIHFTGSLNAGMSGGPALAADGRVVGINVSTAGGQVSFLVPVARLRELLARAAAPGWNLPEDPRAEVQRQIFRYQDEYVRDLLSHEPAPLRLGDARVPTRPAPWFDCWGDALHEEEDLYEAWYHRCTSSDWIYVSDDHTLAPVWMAHQSMRSRGLAAPRFAELYTRHFEDNASQLEGSEEVFTPFSCHTRFVESAGDRFKTTFCARRYVRLPDLYDVVFKAALLGRDDAGAETALVMSAIGWENALRLSRRHLESVAWKSE